MYLYISDIIITIYLIYIIILTKVHNRQLHYKIKIFISDFTYIDGYVLPTGRVSRRMRSTSGIK